MLGSMQRSGTPDLAPRSAHASTAGLLASWHPPTAPQPPVRRRSRHHSVAQTRASVDQGAVIASENQPQPYIGNDGRRKATFEESFRLDRDSLERMPWQLSWQRNERTLKFTDETRAHLVKGFAAKELGIAAEEMDRRLGELVLLLPELPAKLAVMKPRAVAFMAGDTNRLARSLIALKGVFPSANVAAMAVKQPSLLMERSPAELEAAAEKLRELLPDFDVDWLVEQHPQVPLDVDTFGETLAEAKRMMPQMNVANALRTRPSLIFSFERRGSMIPYDS